MTGDKMLKGVTNNYEAKLKKKVMSNDGIEKRIRIREKSKYYRLGRSTLPGIIVIVIDKFVIGL